MQSELPAGFAEAMRASDPPLAETYEESGWCFVEAAISAGVKVGARRLDLSRRTDRAMGRAYGGANVSNTHRRAKTCRGRRLR